MFASKDTLLTRPSGYNIARSVRLRSSATAYFNRTPASSTSSSKYTLSMWVKLGAIQDEMLFAAGASTTNQTYIRMYGGGSQAILWETDTSSTTNWAVQTNAVYRDPSAWYHLVFAYDSSLSGLSNQAKIYVNGVQTAVTTSGSGTNSYVNTNVAHYIGRHGASSLYFDGYIAETQLIDGQALTPSSFGETDSITGVWKPKAYSGTYGTNGFELNFSDNSNNTAATIGKDYSGNGNNWTPNNISVTAGATYDSMQDVPTLTSATAANYVVLNPLDDNTNMAPSNGNLDWVNAGATQYSTRSTIFPTSGKWYAEFTISSSAAIIAIANQNAVVQGVNGINGVFALTTFIYNNSGTAAQSGLASFAASDVIAVAYDADTNSVQFYRNNSTYGTAVTPSATGPFCFYVGANGATCTVNANFGQRPFSYTPPTGFVALNTYNLPASTIKNGAAYMAATTYTGNGSTQSISNAVNGVSFQPDWVWAKSRSTADANFVLDSVRGATINLYTNGTAAEFTQNTVTAFNSGGFSVGSQANGVNTNAATYIGWQWKAGTTSASNTNGTITSTVSAGATQGFSVVTYTGTGANATVGHGLGVAPSMIIVKERNAAGDDWYVYHANLTSASYSLRLNTTAAQSGPSADYWNSTAPTSSVFSLGVSGGVNQSTNTYVAYCFAAVAGYSAFGKYTGNNSADGPFVYTGFRPRWILFKDSTNAATNWVLQDTSRFTYNLVAGGLLPNTSASEYSSGYDVDILSNGFKIRRSGGDTNASGATIIYAAFAENPFKNSLAR